MKALVLAGGRGKRLNELSESHNKCVTPVSGKPAIEYSLDCILQTPVEEIIIVVGYHAEQIINHYGNRYQGRTLRYVIQWEQKGLVHAIECAREAIGGEDFMLLLGDEIVSHPRHDAMFAEFDKGDAFALCGVWRVKGTDLTYIRRTYAVICGEDNTVHRLIEKPRTALNDIMGTGKCIFRNAILDYLALTPTHQERKERELPDLIQCAIDDGKRVRIFEVCDGYVNINTMEDIAMAEAILEGRP